MKKYIALIVFLTLAASACSETPSSNNPNPGPSPSPAPSGPKMLRGTVSMILNFIAPSSYAMAPARFGSQNTIVSLPYNTAAVGCQAARCAFLVDTGARDSTSTKGDQMEPDSVGNPQMIRNSILPAAKALIAVFPQPNQVYVSGNGRTLQSAPVIDGKFAFTFDDNSPAVKALNADETADEKGIVYKGAILKIIVRGWDPATQTPLARSPDDREIALSAKDLKQSLKQESEVQDLAINLDTTMISPKKQAELRLNADFSDDGSFLQNIADILSDGIHSIDLASIFANLESEGDLTSTFQFASNNSYSSSNVSKVVVSGSLSTSEFNMLINNPSSQDFATNLQANFTHMDSLVALAEAEGLKLSTQFDEESTMNLINLFNQAGRDVDSLTATDTTAMTDEEKQAIQVSLKTSSDFIKDNKAAIRSECTIADSLSALQSASFSMTRTEANAGLAAFVSSEYLSQAQADQLSLSVKPNYSFPYTLPAEITNGNYNACCMARQNSTYNSCND
jgi:hypothetical protein